MHRKTIALAVSVLLMLSLLTVVPASAEEPVTELLSFPFNDEAAQGSLFAMTDTSAATAAWVKEAGVGHGDDTVIKMTHIEGAVYTSSSNALRLTLAEPLPPGGVYKISAWFYVPSADNQGKGTLTGPGFVLNADYAGAQGVAKFPENFGTIKMDEWKQIDVTLPVQDQDITTLDFRFVINDEPKHPDVWYIDDIVISRIGEIVEVEIPTWDLTLPSIADSYKEHFPVGNVLEPNQLMDNSMMDMYKHHYNVVTFENSMKPVYLSTERDVYSFGGADSMVDWALENGIAVHGHTLVWHSQSARWLTSDDSGNLLTRAEAKANLEKYINEVAGHFKGKVISWDVVNEALESSTSSTNWKSALRKGGSSADASPWYAAYENGADKDKGESGADYIYDAFVFARLADPGAMLFYNDFNETETSKREAMAGLAEALNFQWKTDPRNTEPDRPLVEGLGMQAHYWTDDLNPANVDATIARFISAGCKVAISELDIPAGGYGSLNSRSGTLTAAEAENQAKLYKMVFEVFLKYEKDIARVTLWGKADPQSWRAKGNPLLFDALYKAKPAYYSVMSLVTDIQPPAEEEPDPSPETTLETSPSAPAAEVPSATPAPTEPPSGGGNTLAIVLGVIAVVVIGVVLAIVLGRKKK